MAGLPWFKLHGDFFSHPKTLELQEELGDPCADVYVVRMWAYVSRVAAAGRLTGRNVAAVLERAIGWGGLPGRFVTAALAVGFLEQDGEALVVHDWEREQGAHVAKVERDRKRPNSKARVSDDSGDPARGSGGDVAGPRENPEVEREIERESKRKASASQASAAASPPILVVQEAAPEKPKRAPNTSAMGEFLDWARAETKPRLPPDALDPATGMKQHERVRLGEAVKLHGLETVKAAFRLFMGWQVAESKGYSVGFFASQWEGWVRQAKAPVAPVAATTPKGSPDDERARALREAVAQARAKQAAGGAS